MAEPSVWVVGDWPHADFSAAMAWLQGRARCTFFDDPSSAITSRQSEPLAMLLAQSRPGQISSEQVERLHAAAPLARLVALVGPWCEGEMRSGQPWPGVARVPWRAWRQRLNFELGLTEGNGSLGALLPRSATETERIERAMRWRGPKLTDPAQAVVYTQRKERFDSVADALVQLGWQTSCSADSISDVDLMIFDGWDQIQEISQAPDANKLLLLDFPRPEDHERALALGIRAVVGLPLLLADLAMAIDRPQNSPS